MTEPGADSVDTETAPRVTAGIRNLWGQEQPAVIADDVSKPDEGLWAIEVPALGVLMIAKMQSRELIVRLGVEWRALLIQPDRENQYSASSNQVERDAKVLDNGDVEVELLPNSSGEDRIVVVLHGAAA